MEILYSIFIGIIFGMIVGMIVGIGLQAVVTVLCWLLRKWCINRPIFW